MTEERQCSKNNPHNAIVTEVEQEEVARLLQTTVSHSSQDYVDQKTVSVRFSRVPRVDLDTSSVSKEEDSQNEHVDHVCNICGNSRFQEPTATAHDKRMVKPCFCDFRCHHGCLLEIVTKRKKCLLCDVQYRVFKYGSILDFFKRYWYQYLCCLLGTGLLFIIGICGLFKALFSHGNFGLARFCLLAVAAALVIIAFSLSFLCCRNTFANRIRRFRDRYGQITIFDYKPDSNIRGTLKPTRDEFKTLDGHPSMGMGTNVTVGQYLLGHKKTGSWQDSSTPLATGDEHVRFSFDTPVNDLNHYEEI